MRVAFSFTNHTKRRTVLTVRLFVFVRIVLNPRPLPKCRAPENRSEVFIFNKKSFFSRKIAGAGAEIFVNRRQSQVLIEPCLSRHGAKQGAGEAAGKRSDRAPAAAHCARSQCARMCEGSDEGSSPVTSTTNRALPFGNALFVFARTVLNPRLSRICVK